YEVRIADLRRATAQDHSRVMAERAYADGRLLESQGKAESFRKAIGKYEEALKLYRTAGDRRGEGDTFHQIGEIQADLGGNPKAHLTKTRRRWSITARRFRSGEPRAITAVRSTRSTASAWSIARWARIRRRWTTSTMRFRSAEP